jgi:hypothetical protein
MAGGSSHERAIQGAYANVLGLKAITLEMPATGHN